MPPIQDDAEDSQGVKKRTRQPTTPYQAAILTKLFSETAYPSAQVREEIGKQIGMSARRVQVWLQNRRQAEKNALRAKAAGAAGDSTAASPQSPSETPHTALPGRTIHDRLEERENELRPPTILEGSISPSYGINPSFYENRSRSPTATPTNAWSPPLPPPSIYDDRFSPTSPDQTLSRSHGQTNSRFGPAPTGRQLRRSVGPSGNGSLSPYPSLPPLRHALGRQDLEDSGQIRLPPFSISAPESPRPELASPHNQYNGFVEPLQIPSASLYNAPLYQAPSSAVSSHYSSFGQGPLSAASSYSYDQAGPPAPHPISTHSISAHHHNQYITTPTTPQYAYGEGLSIPPPLHARPSLSGEHLHDHRQSPIPEVTTPHPEDMSPNGMVGDEHHYRNGLGDHHHHHHHGNGIHDDEP